MCNSFLEENDYQKIKVVWNLGILDNYQRRACVCDAHTLCVVCPLSVSVGNPLSHIGASGVCVVWGAPRAFPSFAS